MDSLPRWGPAAFVAIVVLVSFVPAAAGLTGGLLGQDAHEPTRYAVAGLDGLRLPTVSLLQEDDDPQDALASEDPATQPDDAEEGDEALEPHQRPTAGSPAAGEAEEGFSWYQLLWGLPIAALGLAGVLVSRHHDPTQAGEGTDGGLEQALVTPVTRDEADAGAGQAAVAARSAPPKPGVAGVLQMGQEAVLEQRFEDAVRWFETAMAVQPRLPVAHMCLGLCLENLARYEQAAEAFGNCASLEPENPAAAYNQARCLCRIDREEAALSILAPVLEAYPDMVGQFLAEEAFQGLRDHPRLLALIGRL